MKCKLLIEGSNIQIAVDEENKVLIRTYGTGHNGSCWGTWHTFDLNPRAWKKLDSSRIRPCAYSKAWPIKQDVLDGLELLIDTTR